MKTLGLVVSNNKICIRFVLLGGAIFDPVGRIYKEAHYTLLHTKYESSRPCGFGEDLFSPMTPRGMACMDPKGHGCQDL